MMQYDAVFLNTLVLTYGLLIHDSIAGSRCLSMLLIIPIVELHAQSNVTCWLVYHFITSYPATSRWHLCAGRSHKG